MDMHRLLRGRLGIVQMLTSVTIFNLAHADKCIDFLLSESDKNQWQVFSHYCLHDLFADADADAHSDDEDDQKKKRKKKEKRKSK